MSLKLYRFLKLLIFNNVFSHDETGYNSVKNKTPQKRSKRKKPSQTSRSLKMQRCLRRLELAKNWSRNAYFELAKRKF